VSGTILSIYIGGKKRKNEQQKITACGQHIRMGKVNISLAFKRLNKSRFQMVGRPKKF
jgi:hypothetical protein